MCANIADVAQWDQAVIIFVDRSGASIDLARKDPLATEVSQGFVEPAYAREQVNEKKGRS